MGVQFKQLSEQRRGVGGAVDAAERAEQREVLLDDSLGTLVRRGVSVRNDSLFLCRGLLARRGREQIFSTLPRDGPCVNQPRAGGVVGGDGLAPLRGVIVIEGYDSLQRGDLGVRQHVEFAAEGVAAEVGGEEDGRVGAAAVQVCCIGRPAGLGRLPAVASFRCAISGRNMSASGSDG